MHIFGIKIDNLSKKRLLRYLHDSLGEPKFHRIATINPEFLLRAQEDPNFRANLQHADLRVADGVGVRFVYGLHGEHLEDRIPGADITRAVLTLAAAHHFPVFLAIRKDGLSSLDRICATLKKKFPDLICDGAEFSSESWRDELPTTTAAILLCNFGAPEQEYFVEAMRSNPHLRLALGVGGSFDYLTGAVKRAPKWMRQLGFEWLWRLIEQPNRLPRILRAVFLFPWRVFTEKAS